MKKKSPGISEGYIPKTLDTLMLPLAADTRGPN